MISFLIVIFFICLSIIFFIISKVQFEKAKKIKQKNIIQEGKIIYSDLSKPEKPLFSKKYRIIGKPDYIIKNKETYTPVEIKTGNHKILKKNHIYQIAAYCQILEDYYNCYIPYGIIIYKDTSKQFKIPFDPKLRFELTKIISEIRKNMNKDIIQRNHYEIKKCIKCSLRKFCEKKLT